MRIAMMEERFGGKGDRSRSRRRLEAKERSLLKNNAVLFAIGGVRRTNLRLRREMPRWPLTVPACRNTLTCIPAQSVRVLADPASAPAPAFAPRLASPRLFPPRRAPPRPDLARPPLPSPRPASLYLASPSLASLQPRQRSSDAYASSPVNFSPSRKLSLLPSEMAIGNPLTRVSQSPWKIDTFITRIIIIIIIRLDDWRKIGKWALAWRERQLRNVGIEI